MTIRTVLSPTHINQIPIKESRQASQVLLSLQTLSSSKTSNQHTLKPTRRSVAISPLQQQRSPCRRDKPKVEKKQHHSKGMASLPSSNVVRRILEERLCRSKYSMEKILKGLLREPAPLYQRLSRRASRAPSRQKLRVVGNLEKVLSAERLPQLVKQKNRGVERVPHERVIHEKAGRSMIPVIEDNTQCQTKDEALSPKCEHTRSSSVESLPTLQSVRRVVVFTKFKKEQS